MIRGQGAGQDQQADLSRATRTDPASGTRTGTIDTLSYSSSGHSRRCKANVRVASMSQEQDVTRGIGWANGLALGIVIGSSIGLLLGNFVVGMSIGVGVGSALGVSFSREAPVPSASTPAWTDTVARRFKRPL
jgi:hypothetical protein